MSKRSDAALLRMVEAAIVEAGALGDGVKLLVHRVQTQGSPPNTVEAWVTRFFLPRGKPHCCPEPGCHSAALLASSRTRSNPVEEYLSRQMHLTQSVTFIPHVTASYDDAVVFHLGRPELMEPKTE